MSETKICLNQNIKFSEGIRFTEKFNNKLMKQKVTVN